MNKEKLKIRLVESKDQEAMEYLAREAFWNLYIEGCCEHYLVHILTKDKDYLPQYSFVAELDGEVVGCILYSRSYVEDTDGKKTETLTFGPLCILPQYQRIGIGRMLVEKSAEVARENGEKGIIIMGNPSNYVPYGFESCKTFEISMPDGVFPLALLVLPLYEGALDDVQGKYYDCEMFQKFDPKEAEAYDALLPYKEKKKTWSQVEFEILSSAVFPKNEKKNEDTIR